MIRAVVLALLAGLSAGGAMAEPAGKITGIGGVFVASKDPKALRAWYRDVLGVPLESWGGAVFKADAPGHPPKVVWNPYRTGSAYAAPSTREVMIDFVVDDMDAIVHRLEAKGVKILKLTGDDDPSGRFAWLMDPDGTKIELWQAKTAP